MSESRLFSKHKAYEIRAELQQTNLKKHRASATKRKDALRKVIANLSMGNFSEMALLFPDILRFWQVEDDIEVKRICHHYLVAMAPTKSGHFATALSMVLEDFNSGTESARILALRTLSSVPLPAYLEEASKCASAVLHQHSESEALKKAALYALLRLSQLDTERSQTLMSIVDKVLHSGKERPSVRAHALFVLYQEEESSSEIRTLGLHRELCLSMLELLPRLNEWDNGRVLDALTANYVPQTHSDAHFMIDKVLPQLQHANTSVVLNALKFIVFLTNYVDRLNESIVKQLSSSVISLLNKPPELQFLVLRNVILLLLGREKPLLKVDVPYFFVEFNDPIYIKDTKLEILYLLAKEDNLAQIFQELKEYATDIDIQMSRKAIRAVGNLAVKLKNSVDECIDLLLDLLDFEVEYIVQEIISVFKNVLRRYPEKSKLCLHKLVRFTDSVQEPESRSSMIWIITQYSSQLPNYFELFEGFSNSFLEESLEVQFTILSSTVKLFTRHLTPATEKLCISILKSSTEKLDNPDLRDRAFMYWRLLSCTQNSGGNILTMDGVREIVDGNLPLITLNSRLDPQVIEELELSIGTIVSIYLKPVNQVFRLNKPKVLPKSPALNPDKDSLEIIADGARSHSSSFTDEGSLTSRRQSSSPVKKMDDYDRPAEVVNQLKLKRKTSSATSLLSRKPSVLGRKLSMKRPFG
ncbi:LAQU0S17e00254g1_1 [Lachancea quebecensis]|uniref:AP complex subunit beta n=1 Tax=Lachancea quebecensis TaxID=1654605 RepID=A0A0P1KWD4_9SACH|nr:LAQU0S17e00254g1_1 [Lachancea quebecensis]